MNEDLALEVLTEFLNAVDAGIAVARQRMKTEKVGWDASKIQWVQAQGSKGPYERSEDVNSVDFRALLKDLETHGGKLTGNGFFYWKFSRSAVIGRKKRK